MPSAHEQVAAIAAVTARDRMLIAARQGEPVDGPADQLTALLDFGRGLSGAGIAYTAHPSSGTVRSLAGDGTR